MPTPMTRSQLNLRLPPALHESLTLKAKQQGMSANAYCVALLAGATRWSQGFSDQEILDLARARGIIEVKP